MKTTSRTPMRTARLPASMHYQQSMIQTNGMIHEKHTDIRDPVQVFCRIRPLQSDADLCCLRLKDSRTVVLTPPEQALQGKQSSGQKETQYIFKHVFEPSVTQREVFEKVGEPLVENLIRGRNSLLFTYGVTGSGKTYTMTGDARQRGIMPRCLDVLFRTISDYQAKKYIFKPDRLNGFEILSETDALMERQAEMNQRFGRTLARQKSSDTEIASQASCEVPPINGLDEDNMYAVFVTYVEVYNNSVYDLLEDGGIQKNLQCKIIREDANHNMFVHGVTEIEIKSVEEALDAFHTGQKRKRMGHTILNAESSRSHSVFNIRLVQAPTDYQGEHIMQDKRTISVSQLSLVDLAGSERSSRTKNTGLRLREAGNINNSLMTLRTCLEYVRENQQAPPGVPHKKVPYRDAKITHMFKNYFDGDGQISMIVCVNPRAEDFDENTQVLKFAEMTQEVQITRPPPMKPDLGLLPGRRKANKMFKIATSNLNELGIPEANQLETDVDLVYSLGTNFPHYELDSADAKESIKELQEYLKQRIEKRKMLTSDLKDRTDKFRISLLQLERDKLLATTELSSIQCVLKQERERTLTLENKIRSYENTIDVLNAKLLRRDREVEELRRKMNEQQQIITQKEQEKEKQKKKFNSKLAVESVRKDRELANKLQEQQEKYKERIRTRDEQLRLVSNIIQAKNLPKLTRSSSNENLPSNGQEVKSIGVSSTPRVSSRPEAYCTPARHIRGAAAANNRHRRSRSAGEKWLEHRPANPVPLGTIMQPYLKNRKSVTKLTDMKELTANKASKYCLISQEADTDGDVETKLYKGNVIPTCGGGAQVVFDDVELLKQKSPLDVGTRKRPSNGLIDSNLVSNSSCIPPSTNYSSNAHCHDLENRCNIGIEGHSNKRSKV